MPGLTGFEVARRLIEADVRSQLVFVTAFDQYAVDAFSVNAVDYVLKPVDADRLEQTLERARRAAGVRRGGEAAALARRSRTGHRGRAGAAGPPRSAGRSRGRAIRARPGRRGRSRLAGRRGDSRGNKRGVRDVELPDARRAAGAARSGRVLAGAPVAPGQHHEDQGDRPLVQPELPAEDERPEGHGNSRQPVADPAAAGVSAAARVRRSRQGSAFPAGLATARRGRDRAPRRSRLSPRRADAESAKSWSPGSRRWSRPRSTPRSS